MMSSSADCPAAVPRPGPLAVVAETRVGPGKVARQSYRIIPVVGTNRKQGPAAVHAALSHSPDDAQKHGMLDTFRRVGQPQPLTLPTVASPESALFRVHHVPSLRKGESEAPESTRENIMSRPAAALLAGVLAVAASQACAQAPTPPLFSTTKVEGTDGVYIFRYQGHQAMFVVTPDGVIATDPIGERRPAAAAYIAEIRKITQAPIKYVVYSHSHFDHIAGGKAFKDLGAVFIAHKNTKSLLEQRKAPDIVIPDLVVDDSGGKLELGGTTLELLYLGKNHGDSSLIMRLPKEKIIFVVDFLPLSGTQFRIMADTYVPDQEESIKKILAMDWDKLIPGHPGAGGRQVGNKDDVKTDLDYILDLSTAVKQAVDAGKSYADAIRDIKLPKYEGLAGYQQNLAGNIERYYDYWNRGI